MPSSSPPSSTAVAVSAEGENVTALHEYREAVLFITRKHLLKDPHSRKFFVFLSVWRSQLTNAWWCSVLSEVNFAHCKHFTLLEQLQYLIT